MTGGHNLFRLYALVICDHCPQLRGMSRTLMWCLQFPIVTNTLWGQLAGRTMTVLPRSLWLYCTAMATYVYQQHTFPSHYGDNVKVKSQHICQAIPALLRGLGEAVVSYDWCIIYSLRCTSHENLVFSHLPPSPPPPPPKKKIYIYIDPKHKIWHPLIYFSTYCQVHSHPITSFSFWPQLLKGWTSIIFIRWVYFHLDYAYRGALWLFSLNNYSCPELRCIFCIAWCQQKVFGINR